MISVSHWDYPLSAFHQWMMQPFQNQQRSLKELIERIAIAVIAPLIYLILWIPAAFSWCQKNIAFRNAPDPFYITEPQFPVPRLPPNYIDERVFTVFISELTQQLTLHLEETRLPPMERAACRYAQEFLMHLEYSLNVGYELQASHIPKGNAQTLINLYLEFEKLEEEASLELLERIEYSFWHSDGIPAFYLIKIQDAAQKLHLQG